MNPLVHRTQVRVAYADSDAMGMVYYAHYLRWLEVGRTELMRSLGIAYKEMEDRGTFLPVSQVFCKYHVPARYDDILIIETTVDFLRRASIQFSYRILRQSDETLLITGYTLHAFVDREGKIVKVPSALRAKMNI